MNLDGFSMHPLATELNNALVGGRIDKINQPNKQTIIMSIRQPGKNYLLQLSINPQCPSLHLIEKSPENPSEPPVFCMVLRKHLETGRIANIKQLGLDRILTIEIDVLATGGKIVTKTLIAELMGKYSNLILTTDGIITDSLRKVGTNSSRVRTVLPGQPYLAPPAQNKFNLLTENTALVAQRIAAQNSQKLNKAILNNCLGFGPITAREAVIAAGLDADIITDNMQTCDIIALEEALSHLKKAIESDGKSSGIDNLSPSFTVDVNKKITAIAAFPLHCQNNETRKDFSSMSSMLTAAEDLLGSYVPPDKERFGKLISNELHRARNKLSVLTNEAAEAENAEDWRIKGDNLMTWQYSLTDHADEEITVTNIYSDNNEAITIELDRSLTVSQNCQNFYRKYNKLKRAQELLKEQISVCKDNISYLESITESLKSSNSLTEINEIHSELINAGILQEKLKKKPTDKSSQPFEFITPDGLKLLVGKNNLQNDRLTFKIASPDDIWLHTKDIPGSHVILRTNGEKLSDISLLFAAETAAAFSKAADSANVPVDYTLCRHVKKPSGAKPGFVIFTNQKTLYVTPKKPD